MLPDCTDDQLIAELAVVVSVGWELPQRPARAASVRHLLLLVDPDAAATYAQAALRLLVLLDDALRAADDDVLGEDERAGCRILLGVHPNYRSERSPTVRRQDAADLLIPAWHIVPVRDPAGTFQRRHQLGVLRQVLQVIRQRYGQEHDRDYDVVHTRRWCFIDAGRQTTRLGDSTVYRVRRDGLDRLDFVESELPEGCESAEFVIMPTGEGPSPTIESIAPIDTQPGNREIAVRLPRPYAAGELVAVAWAERRTAIVDAPLLGRDWLAFEAPNDAFEIEIEVTFATDLALPDVCWWFEKLPDTDINEIGPNTLSELIDLTERRTATHSWSNSDTERRLEYGLLWVWLDDLASRNRWLAARARLGGVEALDQRR